MAAAMTEDAKQPRPDLTREELWALYKHAIDDRNFQVTLNWDRTKHYFVFNAAIFSVAGAVAHLGDSYKVAVAACLALVAINANFAAFAIWKGHEYYRQSRRRMKDIERRLMADDLAANTTRGMARDTARQSTVPLADRFTITNTAIVLQIYIGIAAFYALARFLW
ncbi:MAG TPA: hypothetical protein VEA38_11285 [Terriglobales bacterium]|nr:hypothetical protein [Terriglobales bacterium]